jgi:hypothetical protein
VKLRADADDAGLSVSELVRRRYFGRKIVARADEKMIRHLNRIGGLLKHVHNQSGGIYAAETARALRQVYAFIDQLANKGPTDDPQENPGRSGQGRAQVQGDQHQ